jgi:hypothetical protein
MKHHAEEEHYNLKGGDGLLRQVITGAGAIVQPIP